VDGPPAACRGQPPDRVPGAVGAAGSLLLGSGAWSDRAIAATLVTAGAAGRGSGTTVVADAKTQTGPYVSQLDFSQKFETIDWSQARYDDYGFIALDVTPASIWQKTTMVLRFINEQGRELDRVVFSRIAGV
jgi:hypothetical protein